MKMAHVYLTTHCKSTKKVYKNMLTCSKKLILVIFGYPLFDIILTVYLYWNIRLCFDGFNKKQCVEIFFFCCQKFQKTKINKKIKPIVRIQLIVVKFVFDKIS